MSRMKQLREEKDITQEELAFVLDISQQRISKIERNKALLSDELIIRCARYFGVTADYFLGISDIRLEMEVDEAKPLGQDGAGFRELVYYFTRMNPREQEVLVAIEKLLCRLTDKE